MCGLGDANPGLNLGVVRVLSEQRKKIRLAPNPADTELIQSAFDSDRFFNIRILDLEGRLIKVIPISPTLMKKELRISINGLRKGMYYLHFLGYDSTETSKFIKM